MANISFDKSLGTRLLRVSFGLYMIVTLIVTAYHVVAEYFHAEESVITETRHLISTFTQGLGVSVWNMDEDQLSSNLQGMTKLTQVASVIVYGDSSEILGRAGLKVDKPIILNESPHNAKNVDIVDLKDKWKENYMNDDDRPLDLTKYSSSYYKISFPITMNEDGKDVIVAKGAVLVDKTNVFNRVEHGFSLILINAIVKTIFLWIIFLLCTRHYVTNPLNKISKAMATIDPQNPELDPNSSSIFSSLKSRVDEIGFLAKSFLNLIETIASNVTTITKLNNNLEEKVKQRTQEVIAKTNSMRDILNNIKEGILVIDEDHKVNPNYSQHLEDILGHNKISHRDFIEVLFSNALIGEDKIDQVKNAIEASFGFTLIAYQLNSELLVREVSLKTNNAEKIIQIDWQPLLVEGSDVVNRYIIVVRDITREKHFEAEFIQRNNEINMMLEVLNSSTPTFLKFYEKTKKSLHQVEECLSTSDDESSSNKNIFRILHTLKGEARTFNYSLMANEIHKSEDYHTSIAKGMYDFKGKIVKKNIGAIDERLNQYYKVAIKITEQNEIDYKKKLEKLDFCFDKANDLFFKPIESVVQAKEESFEIIKNLVFISSVSFQEIVDKYAESIMDISMEMGKEKPSITVKDPDKILVPGKIRKSIDVSVLHLLRNSIDHGIEFPLLRSKLGKDPTPNIHLSVFRKEDKLYMEYFDDGQGLNLLRLRSIAMKSKLINVDQKLSDLDIANLVFKTGFSTRDEVSKISGRGMGMDIVKKAIEDEDGSIKIEFTGEKSDSGHRRFKFVIMMPFDAKHFFIAA